MDRDETQKAMRGVSEKEKGWEGVNIETERGRKR